MTRIWVVHYDDDPDHNIYESETLKSCLMKIAENDLLDLADCHEISIRESEPYYE